MSIQSRIARKTRNQKVQKPELVEDDLSIISTVAEWNADKKRADFSKNYRKYSQNITIDSLYQGTYNITELAAKHPQGAFLDIDEDWSSGKEISIKITRIESDDDYLARMKLQYRQHLKIAEERNLEKIRNQKIKEEKEYRQYLELRQKYETK